MTDAQKFHFYFPAWTRCARANGWHMAKGRLQLDAERLNEEGQKVLALATQRAANAHRGIVLDDLRHGCHLLALGRDKSSEHLTNADLDRVVALFGILRDPHDLGARIKWEAYLRGEDPGATQRVNKVIERAAPEAYTAKVAGVMCGVKDWMSLSPAKKNELARLLKQRNANFRKPILKT